MTLAEISQELRLLAGELRGHDDLDQWIRLEALAGELDKEHRFLVGRYNDLAKRVVAAETELDLRTRGGRTLWSDEPPQDQLGVSG